MRALLLATTAIVPIGLSAALANPQGGQVVGGTASIAGTGTSNVTVTQTSNNAVINWNTFNIGRGETTRFIQPSSSSSVLNRVTGDTNPSQIYGTLSANGRVFVINPNGVLIGNGAVINTAGFLATTHDISNADFMAGRYNFSIPGNPQASVVNLGTITATNSGFAALVAPGVRNAGVITATFGKVALASANGFSLDLYGDKLITIGVNDSIAAKVKDVATGETLKSLVQNEGRLQANGGLVQLTAAAARTVVDSVINTSGVIEARSIGRREGRIVLGGPTAGTKFAGSGTQTVKVSGKLDVSNKTGKGGKIEIVGENIVLTAALLDASGKTGGGKVLIGGDVGGGAGNAAVAHLSQAQLEGYPILTATTVSVDAASHIDVSAKESGDGGKVVVWSDGATVFNGSIAARGGSLGGNGGFAEVSGKQDLAFGGYVDTRAPHGQTGTLLLDPANMHIGASIGTTLLTTDVTVQTGTTGPGTGDIFVDESITWATTYNLKLLAYRNINFASGVTITSTGSGNLVMRADSTGTGTGTVNFASANQVNFSGGSGNVDIFYNPTSFGTQNSSVLNGVTMGSGTFTAYMLVNNVTRLQQIDNNLGGNYALGRDIDASATANWNSGSGFNPIGSVGSPFTGQFNGNGHTISGLTISRAGEDYVGLFASVGGAAKIKDVTLSALSLQGHDYVGGLAGVTWDDAAISNVTVAGTVSGNLYVGGLVGLHGGDSNVLTDPTIVSSVSLASVSGLADIGGLVGRNEAHASISQSSATGAVDGNNSIGGLAGSNAGSVTDSYASAAVTGVANTGGLVGYNTAIGTIASSYSSSSVTGSGAVTGGLVGLNNGGITTSYATGIVIGQDYVGGLVGNHFLGTLTNSYATGAVSGTNYVGGLVGNAGYSGYAGDISYVYATGSVIGVNYVGGLVGGLAQGTVGNSHATGAVTATGDHVGGLVGISGGNGQDGNITLAYATGSVSGANYVGGLVGGLDRGDIDNSYATGAVVATGDYVGGLVGISGNSVDSANGNITLAYALGSVSGTSYVGGLVGLLDQGTISQTYSSGAVNGTGSFVGGLVGSNDGVVSSSFWDTNTSGQAGGIGGGSGSGSATGLTSIQARQQTNYASASWDFLNDWYMIEGETRPFLASEYSTTVTNAHQLQLMSKDPSASYTLANSIDLTDPLASVSGIWTAAGFVPVGDNGTPFTGSFNGGGYAITGLTIDRAMTDYVGLFGRAGSGSTIQNVNLIGGSVTGQNDVGGLVGRAEGTITNVSSSTTVIGQMNVGGLVGNVQAGASVNHAYSSGSVTGDENTGGLVGLNAGTIEYAYATGAVSGDDSTGGLVGHNASTGMIDFTYSSGGVSGFTTDLGGLIGSNAGGTVTNSYWDADTSGQSSSAEGNSLTTAQARVSSNYANWDFTTNLADWYMVDGQTRPMLRSEYSTTITNLHQLQLVALNPSADYKIANGFNAAELASNAGIWASTGFVPISTFSGTLDGQGYTVADLKIAPTANNVTSIGLFGAINQGGVVKNLTLDNVQIVANTHPDLASTDQFIGGLAAFNFGTIEGVTVNGTIDGGSARAMIGGIVGMNGNFDGVSNGSPGAIRYSSADIDITSTGNRVQIGGIAGYNSPSSTIADTFAVVDIAATGTVAPSADCSSSANCEYINVGGLVGFNQGTIQSTFHWPPNPVTTYAQGTIDVGQNGVAGGLVAQNEGFITYTYADVALTGAAGNPGPNQEFDNSTTLGGLAGTNRGLIVASYALGNVGNVADYLTVGGFVGDNAGTISDGGYSGTSYASGTVTAGNHSEAGGFAANSAPDDFFCSSPCTLGDAFTYINTAFITNSSASGDVTVGHTSLAGGFAGFSDSVSDSTASGAVSGGHDSVLGGFVGALNVGATISGSSTAASSSVTGTGANSWIGGFAGVNAGRINGSSSAAGAVEGGSQSLIGGFAGLNVGQLNGVTTAATSTVEGTGTQNVVGGLVGANLGWIRNSTANGDVTTGAQTTAGSLVGANGQLANVAPGQVPYSTFAVGVIQSSVGTGTVNGNPSPQIGSNSLSSLPQAPGVLERCDDSLCDILKNPVLVSNENPDVDNDLLRITQVANIPPPPSNTGPLVLIQLTNPPGGGTPGSGGPPAGISNNNVPPGTPGFTPPPLPLRSVPSIDGERFSSIPPAFETRFFNNEVVVQISSSVSPEELARIARELGLTMVTSQNLGTFGRTAFRFRFTSRQSVRAMIRALEQRSIIAIAQPNYQFRLMQPPASMTKGDPAQYMLNKLHLAEVHKTATGKGVTIAVIDSEVDKRHTELQGTIGSELDTVGVKEPPHSHGTAMAGAIVSRDRLLGVAPDARILAVRAFGETNNSADGTTYNILKGIEWAVSQGARVINMSFAGPRDPSIERALKAAREKGVVLVAAAGNAGPKSPPLYPGADPSVIAVTATDAKDLAFRGANRGAQLSVAAPGVDVLAPAPDETYQMSTGTSIATAHISGVIALMLERDPSLTPQEIRTILEATATDLGPRGKDSQYGWGLVNPKKALDAVVNRKKTSDAGKQAR